MKKSISKIILYYFFGSCTFSFFSCNNDNKLQNIDPAIEMTNKDSLIGKTIIMSDSMESYSPYREDIYMDSAEIFRANYKIFAFINVSCVSCIPDISKWDSLAPTFMKHRVPVILICDAKDNFEYAKYLFEKRIIKHYSFPLFFDTKSIFYKNNFFLRHDLAHQAVLTDANNKIIATGSAIYSTEIKEYYLQRIIGN